MLVPFESLPSHSRLWIYQSNRKFTSEEAKIISDSLTAFTNSWSAHGTPLKASFEIRFDQIVILAVDEYLHSASGCSIDDSVKTIKDLGRILNIDFFDRTRIGFYINGQVHSIRMPELKSKLELGEWNGRSIFINNLIVTKGDLANAWLIPAESSWLQRYLPREKVVG